MPVPDDDSDSYGDNYSEDESSTGDPRLRRGLLSRHHFKVVVRGSGNKRYKKG